MKKYFLSLVAMAAAMLFATSCQESLVEPQLAGPTTFTVQLPEQMGTKAIGDASSVTELLVDVYAQHGTDPIYQTKGTPNGNNGFDVRLNLIQDQPYDILFWAQTEDGYVDVSENDGSFGSLRSVPMNANFLNNDNGAAFFHAEKGFVPNGTSKDIVLVRPFAQLNLGTTDASLITNAGNFQLVSSSIEVTGMANKFNVFEGLGFEGAVETYNYGTKSVPTDPLTVTGVPNLNYVSMNYLAVLGNEKALVDVEASIVVKNIATNETQTIYHTFTNVPVQENYRTNIVGNLISSTTDFVVTIEEGFVDENGTQNPDNKYHVVDNVKAANEVLAAGETYVAINYIKNIEDGETITLPRAAEYYLQIPAVDAKLNIVGDEATKVYITLVEDNSAVNGIELNINTPKATVTVSKVGNPKVKKITSKTAPNTLILDGIVVEEVVVEQGNVIVENKSVVGEIEPKGNAGDITIYVDDESIVTDSDRDFENVIKEDEGDIKFITSAAKLKQLADKVNNDGANFAGQTITLLADIDLKNVEWTSIGTEDKPFTGTFDGNEHTIKNLTVVETEAKEGKAFIGFFGYAKNATIEDLTFENVYLNIACLDIDHSQGHIGAVAGSLEGTSTIENVTVKGDIKVESTVTANGASRVAVVAGGNSYGNVTMKEVHVIANEGSYLKANNNVGALAGQLQGKSVFEDCSSNIDVTGTKFFAGGIIGLAAGDQTFIDCHTTGNVTITAGREGRAHDQYRVGGIAGGWSDGAKNVCTLTGCTYTGKVSGKNSDGSVANPLDYAGYVGRGYTLNGCQGSKVIIDGEEYVEYVQAFNTAAEAGIYYINGVWTINSAAELKMLADKVNGGIDYFAGKTIKLGAEIDLENEEWTPIGSFTEDHGFMGNFDGNGYTIKNLKITDTELTPDTDNNVYAGLFGITEGTDAKNQNYIKNLVIENVTIETTGHIAAAAIAYPYYTQVENITVNGNISIKGGDYTSGVLAYTRRCIDAKNLTIQGNEGSIITGNHTVGGVISDIQMNGGLTANYENFSAEGLRIEASMHVGGISGIIGGQILDGAIVKNVTIISDDARKGIVSGSLGQTSTIINVSYENVNGATNIVGAPYDNDGVVVENDGVWKVISSVKVATWDEFTAALAEGETDIKLTADITFDSNYQLQKDVVIDLNGKSMTLPMINIHKNVTIKNGTINGKMYARTGCKATLEGLTFSGTISDDLSTEGHLQVQGSCDVYAKNCTFAATTVNGSQTRSLSIEGSSSGIRKFEGCDFKFVSWGTGAGKYKKNVYINTMNGTTTVDFTDCKLNGKAPNIIFAAAYPLTNLTMSGCDNTAPTLEIGRAKDTVTEVEWAHISSLIANNKFTQVRVFYAGGSSEYIR